MYIGFKHLHSFLPYILLTLLLLTIITFAAKSGKKEFSSGDKKLALFTLITTHIQATVGLVLYFISPIVKAALASGELMSDATNRFYGVEHISIMLLAAIMITVGYSKSKKSETNKFKPVLIFYTVGLVFILSRIPWDAWLGI
jgi:NADH:ubiquinone oxidoreductase subunit 2 (subunit N)